MSQPVTEHITMTETRQRITVVDLLSVGLEHKEEPSVETYKTVGTQLAKAFADIGFVYVTNHGVTEDMVSNMFEQSTYYFAMTVEEKNRLARIGKNINQGYVAADREKLSADSGRHELRESYDVNNLEGPFPDKLVPQFRPAVLELVVAMLALTKRLLRALEHGLGVPKDTLMKCHSRMLEGSSENATCLRVLHYPPVPVDSPVGTLRCGSHTDYGTITILQQDKMGGLEVRERSGEWVAAIPLPGALLLNVGDLLQMWTKNVLIATLSVFQEHRVLVPLAEHKQRQSRRSMAFFIHPDNEVIVKALDGSEDTIKPITALQHVVNRFAESYQY